MHDEPDLLRKEILRLQAILDHHGIDYEPEEFGPPDRPLMGPPTLYDHIMALTLKGLSSQIAKSILSEDVARAFVVRDVSFSSDTRWPTSLRVHLPVDYDVRGA